MILLNFGWMVDLAMSIFEFLTKFLVFWHPWHPWVCIRSVCWKWNLKQIEAIPPSVRIHQKRNWQNTLLCTELIETDNNISWISRSESTELLPSIESYYLKEAIQYSQKVKSGKCFAN